MRVELLIALEYADTVDPEAVCSLVELALEQARQDGTLGSREGVAHDCKWISADTSHD